LRIADNERNPRRRPGGAQRVVRSFLGPTAIATGIGVVVVAGVAWSSSERDRQTLLRVRDGGLVLLEATAIFLLFAAVLLLVVWLCRPERIVIREFENATDNSDLDGPAITTALAAELQRIRAIHAAQQDLELPDRNASMPPKVLSSRERVADSALSFVAPRAVADNVAAVGTVGFAGTQIPLGDVLAALRQLWPFHRSESVITGRLYRHDASLRLVVHLQGPGRQPSKEFATSAPGENFASGFDLLIWSAAAYIAHDLSSEREMSWWSFGHFTDALDEYQDYVRTHDRGALDAATRSAFRIREIDRCVEKVRGLIYNLGLAHLENRSLADAEQLFSFARRAAPKDAVAWNGLGVCYFEQRKFHEAKKAFSQATACKPHYSTESFDRDKFDAQPWNGLANTHVELAEYPDAIRCYQKAIEFDAGAAYPHNGLGNAYLQQELWDEAEEQYGMAIEKDENYAKPWHGKGNVCARRGRFEDALECHRRAIELDGSLAAAWSGVGEAYAHLRRMDDAMDAHRRAIRLRPDEPSPHQSLAETYLLQGDFRTAEQEIHKALELDREASYIWRTLGDLHRQKEEYVEAAEAYRKSVEHNPRNSRAWDGLAKAVRDAGGGDIDTQISAYQRAVEIRDDEPWGWNQLGDAYFQARRFDDSIKSHARAWRLDRGNSYALDGIGKALLALGQPDRAIRFHRAALAVNPQDAYARYGIGTALMAKCDFSGALVEHLKAADLDPRSAYIWNGIGDSHERLRNYDDALARIFRGMAVDAGFGATAPVG
jgi:tetratricopeptide (TPR) repeat protein